MNGQDKKDLKEILEALEVDEESEIQKLSSSEVVKLTEKESFIEISVQDNGIGIDENKIAKLFEPYFTTKDKGTGLGLSIVKKIIEDHGGIIKIKKNKNMAGTTSLIKFELH